MERYTEYHCGVAVIKNKEMLKEAMAKLAAYEDAEEKGKHMNDGWVPVEERFPAEYERIGYDKSGNKYMRRLEVAYMTDNIAYVHGYYDGYKWLDKHLNTIENVVAWKIHEPYRPERINNHDGK